MSSCKPREPGVRIAWVGQEGPRRLAAGDLYVVEGMFASHEVLETRV